MVCNIGNCSLLEIWECLLEMEELKSAFEWWNAGWCNWSRSYVSVGSTLSTTTHAAKKCCCFLMFFATGSVGSREDGAKPWTLIPHVSMSYLGMSVLLLVQIRRAEKMGGGPIVNSSGWTLFSLWDNFNLPFSPHSFFQWGSFRG